MRQIWYIQNKDKKKLEFKFNDKFIRTNKESKFKDLGFEEFSFTPYRLLATESYTVHIKRYENESAILLFYIQFNLKSIENSIFNYSVPFDILHDMFQFESNELIAKRIQIMDDGRCKIFPSDIKIKKEECLEEFTLKEKVSYLIDKILRFKSKDLIIPKDSILMKFPENNLEMILFEKEFFKLISNVKEFNYV